MKNPPLEPPVPLDPHHDLSDFDCGVPALNNYLKRFALTNHLNRSARTFVAVRGGKIVGFYTLAAGSISRDSTPERVSRGLGQHPVPVILLARLGVDKSEQGRGLGRGLLKDALLRALQAADIIGCHAILVHSKDESAKAFYEKFGFMPSPIDSLHLYLLIKDIKSCLR